MVLTASLYLKANREELPSSNNSRNSVTWQKEVFFKNSEDLRYLTVSQPFEL